MAPELQGYYPQGISADSMSPYPADMWAIGAIIFQMMTKRDAFKNQAELFAYAFKSIPFPSSILVEATVSIKGQEFVATLMSAAPGERLTAAQGLQHEWIQRATAEHQILQHPPPGQPESIE